MMATPLLNIKFVMLFGTWYKLLFFLFYFSFSSHTIPLQNAHQGDFDAGVK